MTRGNENSNKSVLEEYCGVEKSAVEDIVQRIASPQKNKKNLNANS